MVWVGGDLEWIENLEGWDWDRAGFRVFSRLGWLMT